MRAARETNLTHILSLQSLLDEFDRQNQVLNSQVRTLLFENKALKSTKLNQHHPKHQFYESEESSSTENPQKSTLRRHMLHPSKLSSLDHHGMWTRTQPNQESKTSVFQRSLTKKPYLQEPSDDNFIVSFGQQHFARSQPQPNRFDENERQRSIGKQFKYLPQVQEQQTMLAYQAAKRNENSPSFPMSEQNTPLAEDYQPTPYTSEFTPSKKLNSNQGEDKHSNSRSKSPPRRTSPGRTPQPRQAKLEICPTVDLLTPARKKQPAVLRGNTPNKAHTIQPSAKIQIRPSFTGKGPYKLGEVSSAEKNHQKQHQSSQQQEKPPFSNQVYVTAGCSEMISSKKSIGIMLESSKQADQPSAFNITTSQTKKVQIPNKLSQTMQQFQHKSVAKIQKPHIPPATPKMSEQDSHSDALSIGDAAKQFGKSDAPVERGRSSKKQFLKLTISNKFIE